MLNTRIGSLYMLLLCLCGSITLNAQTPVVCFDGVNDNINIGDQVGNNVRTVELWFKSDLPVSPSLSSFKALIARELNLGTNEDEFNIAFVPSTIANSGKLRWNIQPQIGQERVVFSDNDTWAQGQWYHVAAVVHPTLGMMLFINGVKQLDTDPWTSETQTSPASTTIGSWGAVNGRYFEGCIEDVRISTDALYTTNFTPPCPNALLDGSTVGLYHFNEGNGNSTSDASGTGNNGTFQGASWGSAAICAVIVNSIGEHQAGDYVPLEVLVTNNGTSLVIQGVNPGQQLQVLNAAGQLMIEFIGGNNEVNISTLSAGMYTVTDLQGRFAKFLKN